VKVKRRRFIQDTSSGLIFIIRNLKPVKNLPRSSVAKSTHHSRFAESKP